MFTEIVTGVIGTIIATYLWETKIRNAITIKRIKSPKDKNIYSLISLYVNLFPEDGSNYTGDEILTLTESGDKCWEGRHVKVENIVLIAILHSEVVGFIFCHLYSERKKAIISYYGIDKDIVEARNSAAKKLLKKLKKILIQKNCEYLFFDIQRPNTSFDKQKNIECKARRTLFKQSAKALNFQAYELQFDYKSPKISLSEDAVEVERNLMCIPVFSKFSNEIDKKTVLEFMEFIYLDCYCDIYPPGDTHFAEYRKYLHSLLECYKNQLPDKIAINK